MLETENRLTLVRDGCRSAIIILVGVLALGGVVAGQDLPTGASTPIPLFPAALSAPLKAQFAYQKKAVTLQHASESRAAVLGAAYPQAVSTSAGNRRITLDEAQQMAAGSSNPMARLGELQVEAAKQHRLGVQALYFPSLGSQFSNLHFNKQPGKVLSLQGPLGNQHQVAVNIFDKDETVVNLSAVQPVTPLLAIRQLVKIARADENIARAKAGMPVTQTASNVEKAYYELLVAQRELISAEAESRKIQGKWLTANSTGVTSISTEQEMDMIGAEKAVILPASKVKELTAALNEMIGLPEGTSLELAPPEPLVENLSLTEVTDKAMMTNPEVVEAEQTAIKAHAAATISKLEYGPNVAVVAGYANQNAVNTVLFPRASGYLGVIATFTIFDFGKREHGVKESSTNAEAADLGVQLVKAKVAAAVKTSYFELDRSRQFTRLAHRMVSATRMVETSYQPDNPEAESARAKIEAEMFKADLEYRQALAALKNLMGEK